MRFVADMGISPQTVKFLNESSHNAIHLHEQSLDRMSDPEILDKARKEARIVLAHDLDFGELMAASKALLPSIIIFRLRNMASYRVNNYLEQVIEGYTDELEKGAIISVTDGQIRIRNLPIESPG